MRACPTADVICLILQWYSEETREATDSEDAFPPRLSNAIDQRTRLGQNVDEALASALADERSTLGRLTYEQYVADKTGPVSLPVPEARFPWVEDSYRRTSLGSLGNNTRVSPFSWIFATASMSCSTRRAAAGGPQWRWFPFPLEPDPLTTAGPVKGRGVQRFQRITPRPVLPTVGTSDVDLIAVASSRFQALDLESMATTILEVFQKPDRCTTLNIPLLIERPAEERGLQRLLVWGEQPAVVLGDTVVIPFIRDNVAAAALQSLGSAPFTWDFVLVNMTIGIFEVKRVGLGSYTVSLIKRLVGPSIGAGCMDPIQSLAKAEVFLDYKYGLLLTEWAIQNSLDWLQRTISPRVIASVPSPVKLQALPRATGTLDSRKRSRCADQDLDDSEDDSRPPPPVVLRDVSGKMFVVSKYGVQLLKATQSIVLRTYVSDEDRQVMFPQAYAHGPGLEALEVYQDPETIIKAAEERLQRASGHIGVREMVRSKSTCVWGRQTDKTFLTNLTLWILTGFDSLEEKRLCMEHYSSNHNIVRISSCGELSDCIRNMIATYDELWGLEWKPAMEPLMVHYFENFESSTDRVIDWSFAARTVIQFFYLVQRAAHAPTEGITFRGVSTPLVADKRLLTPRQWRDFILETFRPYMNDAFNESALWNWSQKKAMLTPPPIFGLHKTAPQGKGKSTKGGNGAPDTTKAGGAGTVKKAKVTAEPTTSTSKFCLVDAFEYLGILEVLDTAVQGRCRGEGCRFTHVSAVPPRKYAHIAVSAGIMPLIDKDKDATAAWVKAMKGRGREVFHGPYGQG
jgi:hypothetical protein